MMLSAAAVAVSTIKKRRRQFDRFGGNNHGLEREAEIQIRLSKNAENPYNFQTKSSR